MLLSLSSGEFKIVYNDYLVIFLYRHRETSHLVERGFDEHLVNLMSVEILQQ